MLEQMRCDVLNANYEPLRPTTARRALMLFLKGKAEIVEEHDDVAVETEADIFPLPLQIRLLNMVKVPLASRQKAILNNRNLFIRDGNCCQYCGRHKAELSNKEFMTRDHVQPRAKGGLDVWNNVVTACSKCNNKKADYDLGDIGMALLKKPTAPTVLELQMKSIKLKKILKN